MNSKDSKSITLLANPSKGTWFRYGIRYLFIGASTKSAAAFFLVPFMAIWSAGSISSIYGKQIVNNYFDPILSLFGLPFLAASLFFGFLAAMTIAGKVEVKLDKHGGEVFTGIGKIGLKKKFNWEEIRFVRLDTNKTNSRGYAMKNIVLTGKREISFGSGLSDSRRQFIYEALKQLLERKRNGENIY
ncbi:MAG: hypothetical protein WBA74_01280 [Cyclobacteriaceae bacterium]